LTPEPDDGYWRTGGPLIRIALLIPPIVGLVVAPVFVSAAVNTRTGLDAANRGWFFLLVPPTLLITWFWVTANSVHTYFGVTALPAWLRRIIFSYHDAINLQRPGSESVGSATLATKVITAVGLTIAGTIAVLLVVPLQVLLTTWLLAKADLYSDAERIIVGIETAALLAWLAYLVAGVRRHRRSFEPH
jgi:hypothetical protein